MDLGTERCLDIFADEIVLHYAYFPLQRFIMNLWSNLNI